MSCFVFVFSDSSFVFKKVASFLKLWLSSLNSCEVIDYCKNSSLYKYNVLPAISSSTRDVSNI